MDIYVYISAQKNSVAQLEVMHLSFELGLIGFELPSIVNSWTLDPHLNFSILYGDAL